MRSRDTEKVKQVAVLLVIGIISLIILIKSIEEMLS